MWLSIAFAQERFVRDLDLTTPGVGGTVRGDFDGNGVDDLVASTVGGLTIYTDANLPGTEIVGPVCLPFPLDVTGDGIDEILCGTDVLQGPAWGAIGTSNCPEGVLEGAVAIDVDQDGLVDVYGSADDRTARGNKWCRSNGLDLSNGTDWPSPVPDDFICMPVDITADGLLDLVCTDYDTFASVVAVYTNDAGTYVLGETFDTRFLADVEDYDADGLPDLLLHDGLGGTEWRRNLGASTFGAPEVLVPFEASDYLPSGPFTGLFDLRDAWDGVVSEALAGFQGTSAFDADGDPGTVDVVVGGDIVVRDVLGSAVVSGFGVQASEVEVDTTVQDAVVRVGDGVPRIMSGTGTLLRPADAFGRLWEVDGLAPVGRVMDLEGDGVDELVTGTRIYEPGSASGVWVLREVVVEGPFLSSLFTRGDVDGDGVEEWLGADRDSLAIGFPDSFGQPLFEYFEQPGLVIEGILAMDLDGNGLDEIVMMDTAADDVVVLYFDGTTVVVDLPSCAEGPMSAVDIDLDGDLDVVACGFAIENTGAALEGRQVDGMYYVADVDLDGDLDGIRADAGWTERLSSVFDDVLAHPPAVAWSVLGQPIDVDSDGDLDFLGWSGFAVSVFRNTTNAPIGDPDSDGYGTDDNCPDVRNLEQFDLDSDGFGDPCDCAPLNNQVYPGAPELCDGDLEDCDGEIDAGFDQDGDGVFTCGPDATNGTIDDDCDDTNPDVGPFAYESAYDGVDNDCDPTSPDDDLDGDGVLLADDCNDLSSLMYPGAEEVLGDGIDNDCDPSTADTATPDPTEPDPTEPDPSTTTADTKGGASSGGCGCDATGAGGGWAALVLVGLLRRRRG